MSSANVPARQEIRAEMVANVAAVLVSEGDEVAAGTTLMYLESMKMEIPVLAEEAGRVSDVAVSAGDVVQEGDLLVALD